MPKMFSAITNTLFGSSTSNTSTNTSEQTVDPEVSLNTRENLHVEVLTIKDYKKAARTLQIAFAEDLYISYLMKDIKESKLKNEMNLALFEAATYSTILSGVLVGIRDLDAELIDPNAPFLAVACFWKPEKKSSKSSKKSKYSGDDSKGAENHSLFSYVWSMYQAGYLKFVWLADKETRKRVFDEQWKLLDEYRAETLGDDFNYSWYLSDIGAIPRGRGKGLARKLVDYVCQKFVDNYKQPKEEEDDEDDEDDVDVNGNNSVLNSKNSSASDEESKLNSEIQSFNFQFDLDSDNLTDYSGYSSFSDNESAHSSWYYNEDEDILSKYDQQQQTKNMTKTGRPRVGAPLYLESSHPRNRKIYQKLGFTYIKTVPVADIPNDDGTTKTLTMDLMVRGVKGAKYKQEKMFS